MTILCSGRPRRRPPLRVEILLFPAVADAAAEVWMEELIPQLCTQQ